MYFFYNYIDLILDTWIHTYIDCVGNIYSFSKQLHEVAIKEKFILKLYASIDMRVRSPCCLVCAWLLSSQCI